MYEIKLRMPDDDLDLELEDKEYVYLVVESDGTTLFPKILGVYTADEYEQAKANSVGKNQHIVAAHINKPISLEELSYVED